MYKFIGVCNKPFFNIKTGQVYYLLFDKDTINHKEMVFVHTAEEFNHSVGLIPFVPEEWEAIEPSKSRWFTQTE